MIPLASRPDRGNSGKSAEIQIPEAKIEATQSTYCFKISPLHHKKNI